MSQPRISVILPVYNAALYLREAIESILDQDFADFELIIVDDGSKDDSAAIVESYTDSRIRFFRNESNRGLVYTLNRGIAEARGEFIARMDGDDISLPHRFSTQIKFLDANQGVDLLASRIQLIDERGEPSGTWLQEEKYIDEKSIARYLVFSNCIAHPSVMGRIKVFKLFPYREEQRASEDYDLWLRLLANGGRICKIPEVLLRYRTHSSSIMGMKNGNAMLLVSKVKFKLFVLELRQFRLSRVVLVAFIVSIPQFGLGILKELKKYHR